MEVRIVSKHKKIARLPRVRPSLLDPRLRGDQWIGPCSHPELLVVYLNNVPTHLLAGSTLDMASLNHILFTLRHRSIRQK